MRNSIEFHFGSLFFSVSFLCISDHCPGGVCLSVCLSMPRPHSICNSYFLCVHQFLLYWQKQQQQQQHNEMFFTFLAKEVINKPETDADWTIKRGGGTGATCCSSLSIVAAVSQFCWLGCGACPFSAASAAILPPFTPRNNSPALWANQVITPNTLSSCVCASVCVRVTYGAHK